MAVAAIPGPAGPAPSRPAAAFARWLPVVLFAGAALLATILAVVATRGGAVTGCGPGSGCLRVLQSRWAYWLGVPVSAPAALVYLALFAAAWRGCVRGAVAQEGGGLRVAAVLSAVVIAAAVWFLVLQAFVLRAYCILCLVTHAAAVAGAGLTLRQAGRTRHERRSRVSPVFALPGLAATAGLAGLIGGQILSTPRTHAISELVAPAVSATGSGGGRVLRLHDGRFEIDVGAAPRWGAISAPDMAVSLFDYTCSHCRVMHDGLERSQRELSDRVAVVLLPVPLDAGCNPLVAQTSAENAGACEYARLALAVWLARPAAFAGFHGWLFAPPRPPAVELARAEAERLVGVAALQRFLADPRLERQLRLAIELFAANSRRAGTAQLPQLMLGRTVSVGPIHDRATLRLLLLGALAPPRDD